jgi:hypothetical protein
MNEWGRWLAVVGMVMNFEFSTRLSDCQLCKKKFAAKRYIMSHFTFCLSSLVTLILLCHCTVFVSFQFRFSTSGERCLLLIGFLGAFVTAATGPLNILLFGELTGELVKYAIGVVTGNPDPDAFLEAIRRFAGLNSILGLVMLTVTYVSVWTYNFVANRQVRNFLLCGMVIMFSSCQQYKVACLNIAYAEVST